jgi:hypothetical protein
LIVKLVNHDSLDFELRQLIRAAGVSTFRRSALDSRSVEILVALFTKMELAFGREVFA